MENKEEHNKLYHIWYGIKQRCYNSKKTKDFNSYGAKGIIMCEEWKNDFLSFKKWSLNNGYKNGLSIDRIDNNGNYEPSNCRWVEISYNSRHQKKVIYIDGMSLLDIAEKYNIKKSTIKYRYIYGGARTINELITPRQHKKEWLENEK